MGKWILALSVVLSCSTHAEVYQLNIGQHQNLQSGDVAVVHGRGQSSTIVCMGNGGGNLPPRQRYSYTYFQPYEKTTIDIYPVQVLEMNCQTNASLREPKQAIAMAVAAARELCFQDYNNCAPPLTTTEQLAFNFVGHGRMGCEVTAFMIGTNPNR